VGANRSAAVASELPAISFLQLTSHKIAFSNEDLVELEWVFASVCEAIEAKQGKQNERAKTSIGRRLFVIACNGMCDPLELRNHLVRSFTKIHGLSSSSKVRNLLFWNIASIASFSL
jgi:hypothetical protein